MQSIIIESFAIPTLGIAVKLIVSSQVMKKLCARNFRGKAVARSGNSSRWDTPREMIEDPLFTELFESVIAAGIEENRSQLELGVQETIPLQFPPDVHVGWVQVLDRSRINGAKLHIAKIGQGHGIMVAPSDIDHPAPRTNLMHLEVSYKVDFKNKSDIAIRILDLTFGEIVDEVVGDLTRPIQRDGLLSKPRQIVFFSPEHPGGTETILIDPCGV